MLLYSFFFVGRSWGVDCDRVITVCSPVLLTIQPWFSLKQQFVMSKEMLCGCPPLACIIHCSVEALTTNKTWVVMTSGTLCYLNVESIFYFLHIPTAAELLSDGFVSSSVLSLISSRQRLLFFSLVCLKWMHRAEFSLLTFKSKSVWG